jgi:hypothetical protein
MDNWMRFGVADGQARWSATWKLWSETRTDSPRLHLSSRFLGGCLIAQAVARDLWQIGFAAQRAAHRKPPPRLVDCPRPADDGCITAFRILTPSRSVTRPHVPGRFRYIAGIPRAASHEAVEVSVVLADADNAPLRSRPRLNNPAPILLGSLPVADGMHAMVLYRVLGQSAVDAVRQQRPPLHAGTFPGESRRLLVTHADDGVTVIDEVDSLSQCGLTCIPHRPESSRAASN